MHTHSVCGQRAPVAGAFGLSNPEMHEEPCTKTVCKSFFLKVWALSLPTRHHFVSGTRKTGSHSCRCCGLNTGTCESQVHYVKRQSLKHGNSKTGHKNRVNRFLKKKKKKRKKEGDVPPAGSVDNGVILYLDLAIPLRPELHLSFCQAKPAELSTPPHCLHSLNQQISLTRIQRDRLSVY